MVYKGCQKRMIVLKNPEGNYFEEAYFIIKEMYKNNNSISEDSMVREANRILSKYSLNNEKKQKEKKISMPVLSFLSGVGTGIGILWLLYAIIS